MCTSPLHTVSRPTLTGERTEQNNESGFLAMVLLLASPDETRGIIMAGATFRPSRITIIILVEQAERKSKSRKDGMQHLHLAFSSTVVLIKKSKRSKF